MNEQNNKGKEGRQKEKKKKKTAYMRVSADYIGGGKAILPMFLFTC